MTSGTLAGTTLLVRHSWRRDRVLASLWGLALVAVAYASAAATSSLYPTVRDQVAAAEAINASPAIVALYGPILDVTSLGELAMTKMTVLYSVFVAALFVVLLRRHTRVEEESGRAELLGGTAIGRDAPLASAVVESSAIAVAIGLPTAAVNVAGGLPLAGSLAFGAGWIGIGLVAIGIGAVASQVSASARTCGAAAAGAIGAAYLLRAVGDTSVHWLSWATPFGWSTQLRAYSDPRWWVLALYAVLAVALLTGAQALRSRRDLGSGLVAARPGPADAAPGLTDALALALRVHTPTIAVWSAATAVLGAVLGAIVPNVGDLLDSEAAREVVARLGGDGAVERALIAAELSIVAIAVSCFGIAVIAHGGADEQAGRTELVLATGTSRARSFGATLLVALTGATWLLAVSGAAVALGYGIVGGDVGDTFGEILPAALAQAPAAWVVVALAALAFSVRASWTVAGWGAVALFVTLGQVGELLGLPAVVLGLSPYTHTPSMPVEAFAVVPEMVLTAIAAALLGVSWMRYRTRDLG
ncbi:hypothetical protein EFK50_05855 [Nocardioides marmoriginsengisoli]|uniref:Polyketide antibiotic transporter n=1 Tax=Nocardioides marmoriginsengisoli TaxID=661483 RepID=A0A3N0CKV8_9ACTN|nr:hypothetical protein [Nocardioides marmoriginsengisoli]RNL64072.1 hypothetical protein EFK50_05855 [Nocardioides marmoriginsengisoli]